MIPGSFAYHRPSSVKEAVGLLGSLGDDGRAQSPAGTVLFR